MIKIFNKHLFAISAAASWAWGVSIVVGSQIVQQRGDIPFLIWAAANSLALPVFAFAYERVDALDCILASLPVRLFKIVIQLFCVFIQLTAIRQIGNQTEILPNVWGLAVPEILFIFALIIVGVGGLRRAAKNNVWQWGLICVGCAVGILAGMASEAKPLSLPFGTDAGDIKWGIWSAIILFSGPFVDHQHYQRVKVSCTEEPDAYKTAGILFAAYMVLVFAFAHYQNNIISNVCLMAITFGVTLSTLDSAISAMCDLTGKPAGVIMLVTTAILWAIIPSSEVMSVWTLMGTIRVIAVCVILALALIRRKKNAV